MFDGRVLSDEFPKKNTTTSRSQQLLFHRPSFRRISTLERDWINSCVEHLPNSFITSCVLQRSPLSLRNAARIKKLFITSSMKSIFTTYGTLRASVIEALDIVETSNKKNHAVKYNVFVVLKVVDDSGVELKSCQTEIHPYYTSDPLLIGEEFLFENAASTQSLVVSLHILNMEKTLTKVSLSQSCLGFTRIPLSRLEENRPVSTLCF